MENFLIPPNIQTFELYLKSPSTIIKARNWLPASTMKHWLSSKSHPLGALPWKWEWGKQALFHVCFNASLWEESSIPDTPGAFTPQNSEETALSPAHQSAGQMGKSKAGDSKWQAAKSSSTVWFVTWNFCLPDSQHADYLCWIWKTGISWGLALSLMTKIWIPLSEWKTNLL